jgi:hypothetical protein
MPIKIEAAPDTNQFGPQPPVNGLVIYECGICGCYHPWLWHGDCRDDANRISSPEEYAETQGVTVWNVEVRSMEDRAEADERGEL